MSEPLGRGERDHPKAGNATLTTYTLGGDAVRTPLWIDQFATDLNMQLDSAQARDGLIHRPIRMTERFLMFGTLWNVADRDKYLKLIEKLRTHWAYNLNQNRDLKPMKLQYYGANKTWLGIIEAASVGYAVTDVILNYAFNMRLIPTAATNHSRVGDIIAPYVPSAQDAKTYGSQWYNIGEFVATYVGVNNEGSSGARNGDKDPIVGEHRPPKAGL